MSGAILRSLEYYIENISGQTSIEQVPVGKRNITVKVCLEADQKEQTVNPERVKERGREQESKRPVG